MALPLTINTTYAPGSQIKSADLNDLQNMIVQGGKHGLKTVLVPAPAAHSNTWQLLGTLPGTPFYWAGVGAGNGASVAIPLPVEIGHEIKAVRAHVKDTAGANTVTLKVVKYTKTTITQLGTDQVSAGDASEQELAVTGLTEVVVADTFYVATVENDGGLATTNRFYGLEIDLEKP